VSVLALVFALLATAGWLYLLFTRKEFPLTWTAGVTLVWALAMTIWLPYLDHPKTYRGVIYSMSAELPAGSCVATRGLTEPQRAMFDYFGGILPGPESCPVLLVHSSTPAEPPHGNEWKLVWRGTRPGDDKEFFWLLRRR
jgi:hypothetical protein